MAEQKQFTPEPAGKAPKSISSKVLGWLRSNSERITGRGRVWSWLWEREFNSLIRDQNRGR